jgi:outer membrane protein assembly factor BamB
VTAAGALFSLVVALLLLANLVQVRAVSPLQSPALETLRAQLKATPGDAALREQIRALDLLARKAFFASLWQRQAGAYLLLGGLVVTLGAARVMARHRQRTTIPAACPEHGAGWLEAALVRRWVAAAGGGLLIASVTVALLVRSPLDAEIRGAATAPTTRPTLGPDDWPFFRGPRGDGVASGQQPPLTWNAQTGAGIVWKTEVPLPGASSPVVVGDRVLLTGADERTQEVYCFDRATGALRWRRAVGAPRPEGAPTPQLHPDTGYAPSTVATDGRHVFAIFPTGDLAALDLDGNPVWSESLGVPENHYGHSSSLITASGLLIVQWDQSTDAKLLAFDAATGRPAWRAVRDAISWASPTLIEVDGRTQLVVAHSTAVAAYDPATGVLLWRADCLGGELGPSPAFADGVVFVANDRAVAAAVRPGGEVVWTFKDDLPDTASPVAGGGLVILATSYGTLVCLDAATGQVVWRHEQQTGYYASPVIAAGRVYALDLAGVMHVFTLGRTLEKLADAPLGEEAMATPAFSGNRLFVRGQRSLLCIGGA